MKAPVSNVFQERLPKDGYGTARTLFFSNLTCSKTVTSLRLASMIFHLIFMGYA